MRYERVEDLINLVLLLQSRHSGLSIADIQEEFEVSRRTAERMRDAILRLFPDIEETFSDSKIKRWKLPNSSAANSLVSFTAEELAELENAKRKYIAEGLSEKAENLDSVILKIKSLSRKRLSSVETDLEALMEAEGYAIRQYPRLKIDKTLLTEIRLAIKAFRKISIDYFSKSQNKLKSYILHPYGILYSGKNYLVAKDEAKQEIHLYILSNIKNLKITEQYFDRDEDFDIAQYSANSFGIFQEEPFDVEWKFSHEVAEDVLNYHFHPTQEFEKHSDGSVCVKFRAGGSYAMCWHLFTWGKHVEILRPLSLKQTYKKLLAEIVT